MLRLWRDGIYEWTSPFTTRAVDEDAVDELSMRLGRGEVKAESRKWRLQK
jgi:hypothetical protein